jgi:quercetin dioxygenase-like cupin family protein
MNSLPEIADNVYSQTRVMPTRSVSRPVRKTEARVTQEERSSATAEAERTRNARVVVQTADVRIVEYALSAGDSHPWHYHSEVTDRIYCLEGLIGVDIREPSQRMPLRPGESCEVPPRTVHHVSSLGDGTSRYLLVQAVGKYDYITAD